MTSSTSASRCRRRASSSSCASSPTPAYFQSSLIVAAAHNMPVVKDLWRFPAVVSVGSHSGTDPFEFYANPKAAG